MQREEKEGKEEEGNKTKNKALDVDIDGVAGDKPRHSAQLLGNTVNRQQSAQSA
ncbi:uncharacterized protein TrAtP1_004656 [Trichoderma atroviride]|uniref:uncharacterized protein n=1 Tax=Hypocrea atroviridis TaxID=63577 RepID=UPI003326796D|nr:hypothetical protein TrAtP1_004656 [Trichoderma atroviride]